MSARNPEYVSPALRASHDIKSPLQLLYALVANLNPISDEQRQLFERCLNRLQAIAQDLAQTSAPQSELHVHDLKCFMEALLLEKRAQYKGTKVTLHAFNEVRANIYLQISPEDLTRILSALIDNAVESSPAYKTNHVMLHFYLQHSQLIVDVRDTGSGLPVALRSKLGRRAVSIGKPDSSSKIRGIGLLSVYQTLRRCQGRLRFLTYAGGGTCARVLLELSK